MTALQSAIIISLVLGSTLKADAQPKTPVEVIALGISVRATTR